MILVITTKDGVNQRMRINNEEFNGMFYEGHLEDVLWFKRQYLSKKDSIGDE